MTNHSMLDNNNLEVMTYKLFQVITLLNIGIGYKSYFQSMNSYKFFFKIWEKIKKAGQWVVYELLQKITIIDYILTSTFYLLADKKRFCGRISLDMKNGLYQFKTQKFMVF